MSRKWVASVALISGVFFFSLVSFSSADPLKPKKGEEASISTPDDQKKEQEISVSDPDKKEELTRKISLQKKLSDLELKLVGPVFSTEI